MTLTTILLFGLAIMGLILLLMIVVSSSKTMFIDKSIDSSHEDDENISQDFEQEQEEQEQITSQSEISEFQTETGCVIFKCDERRRLLDEYHHSSIRNEKFELIFEKPNGDNFSLACSKTAHQKMPYRETGTITFKDDKFIKFESEKQTISDEYTLT